MIEENTVLIGDKPIKAYVTAVVTQFHNNNAHTVVLKARGRAISRAVDVAEILRCRLMKGQVKIEEIKTDTEQFESGDRVNNVSTIEITIAKI